MEARNNASKVRKGTTHPTKVNWTNIKREYITDTTASFKGLATKYKLSEETVSEKSRKEKWPLLRQEVQRKAEIALVNDAENEILEVKKRHVRIAKILQKVGLEALEKLKYTPKTAKDALEFLIEGIKIEKQTMGLDQNKPVPAIVNIIGKEKEIIGKYETVEEVTTIES